MLDPDRLFAAALELGQHFHSHCLSPQQLRRQSAQGLRLNEEVSTSDPTEHVHREPMRDHHLTCEHRSQLAADGGFGNVVVSTVQQTIVFPSVLDYVRLQLVATPMTMLLKEKTEPERQAIISSVASTAATLSNPSMLDGGRFAFPQEAYVAIARPSDDAG
jgi:hypothetical protein